MLSAIFEEIAGTCPYKSPTDMGVNMAGNCIVDDEVVRKASEQEIIRRYYHEQCQLKQGLSTPESVYKLELLMKQAGLTQADRPAIDAALQKAAETGAPAAAIQLNDGRLVTGRTSRLLGACAAVILNALKTLGGIDDDIHLLLPDVLEPIQKLKTEHLGNHNPRLHVDEILLALSVCAASDKNAQLALDQLPNLRNCELHSTVILSQVDDKVLRQLGVHVTCEPAYQTKKLYHA